MSESVEVVNLPLLEWLDVPGGSVKLADQAGEFAVQPFKIAKYPITNAQFEAFIKDGGYKNDFWWRGLDELAGSPRASDWKEPDCPKLEVCWYEAIAFCKWLSHQTGLHVRLPTEWEWQWAAVGDAGWDYPFGSIFDAAKCNTKESGLGRTNAVTAYAKVESPFGAVDMCGNVWEWCLNEGDDPHNTQISGIEKRILRGGSWNNAANNASAMFRNIRAARTRTFNIGFRVIIAD